MASAGLVPGLSDWPEAARMPPSAKAATRVCVGALAAVMGLRWVTRGGRVNGLLAVLCSVLYMASRQRHIKDGRRVVETSARASFAPGDRGRDRAQTTAAQLATERVSRDERRQKMEVRDTEEEKEKDQAEARRVVGQREQQRQREQQQQQQPQQPLPRPGRRASRMAPLDEHQEDDEEEEEEVEAAEERDQAGPEPAADPTAGAGAGAGAGAATGDTRPEGGEKPARRGSGTGADDHNVAADDDQEECDEGEGGEGEEEEFEEVN